MAKTPDLERIRTCRHEESPSAQRRHRRALGLVSPPPVERSARLPPLGADTSPSSLARLRHTVERLPARASIRPPAQSRNGRRLVDVHVYTRQIRCQIAVSQSTRISPTNLATMATAAAAVEEVLLYRSGNEIQKRRIFVSARFRRDA